MTASTGTKARTTRKIAGSLGILGAAAAVAGLGTFGTFTDSTTPVDSTVAAGTLSVDLNNAGSTATLPLGATGFVPGDSVSRAYDLTNSGDLGFAGFTLTTTAKTTSVLDTDKVNGLQLTVASCTPGWTETKTTTGGLTYTCPTTPTTIYTGPAVTTGPATSLTAIAPKTTDHLVVTLALPTTADNGFQGKTSTLSLAFTGTQAAGTKR